jgi:soluble lytic murein transglycosylase-like protein
MLLLMPVSKAGTGIPPTYERIAARYEIPAALLYAVALAESGKTIASVSIRRPWPWTLNVAGEGRYFPTRLAAWRALDATLAAGETRVDIGLMQVNWHYHQQRLNNSWLALQPDHNLSVAAEILKRCYAERGDWWRSVGCYHAPNNAARARRYTDRVRAAWRSVTETP